VCWLKGISSIKKLKISGFMNDACSLKIYEVLKQKLGKLMEILADEAALKCCSLYIPFFNVTSTVKSLQFSPWLIN
jgi:hypothetical protein